MSSSTYQSVTDRILAALAEGTVPWRKPWHTTPGSPANALTKKQYRGINLVLLGMAPFRDHRWLTFRQALELGGNVRKGERSTEVVFWKPLEARKKEGASEEEARRVPLLRTYRVFNAEQCEALKLAPVDLERQVRQVDRIPRAEEVMRFMPDPPRLSARPERSAWYAPSADLVGMPPIASFESADGYYSTLFHELGHSTGHPRRLARPGICETALFGSDGYGREELVAELASAFVCAAIGLDNSLVDNAASYVAGWLRALREDPWAVVVAAGQAQRASEWILGKRQCLSE